MMTTFSFNNVKYDRSEAEMLTRCCSKRMVVPEGYVAFVNINGRVIYGRFKMSMLSYNVRMSKKLDTLRIGFAVVDNSSKPNRYYI